MLRPELAAALGPDRFLREVTTTANLRHPHILPLFDSGEADELLFYVMPFVEGESLRDRLAREKQLPLDDALRIAREVADALRLRPRPRRGPPGYQAGEHPAGERARGGGGFRDRPGDHRRRRGGADRDRARRSGLRCT